MTDRGLMALGFTPHGDGSLHTPARVTLTPSGDAYYRLTIELPSGDLVEEITITYIRILRGERVPKDDRPLPYLPKHCCRQRRADVEAMVA